MTKRRVVVTGIGCLTPLGSTKDKFWNAENTSFEESAENMEFTV